MKKLFVLAIAAAVLLTVSAFAIAPAVDRTEFAAPAFFHAEYEGGGKVEIEFLNNVSYQNLSIEVLNPLGLPEEVTLLEVEKDDLTFSVADIMDETTYTFTVNGVRNNLSGNFETITGQFTTPAAGQVIITELEGDVEDGEVEIDFYGSVAYDNPTVAVTRADGTELNARITDRENDSIELRVRGLTRGEEYTVTITGVAQRGSDQYGSAVRTFIAR